MFGGTSQPPTTAVHCFIVWIVLVVVEGQEMLQNIWLMIAKNDFVGWALNFRVHALIFFSRDDQTRQAKCLVPGPHWNPRQFSFWIHTIYTVFSHGVMATILVSQNNRGNHDGVPSQSCGSLTFSLCTRHFLLFHKFAWLWAYEWKHSKALFEIYHFCAWECYNLFFNVDIS